MHKVADAELVVGIVGRMGIDTKTVCEIINDTLHSLHYKSLNIKITDFIRENAVALQVKEYPIEERYETYIKACNSVREETGIDAFFASYAVERIRSIRRAKNAGDASIPLERTAYIIDQLKRPEEADFLRRIYGQQFILISCHSPRDTLRSRLSGRIAEGHADSPKADAWDDKARYLIEIDDKETAKPHGQRVSDVFPLADLVIDATDRRTASGMITRFFRALFGDFSVSPTRDEFFQNLSFQISLTSCDTARQVGAVVARDGEIISMGFNEAPKAGGGTYWANEGIDGRDIALGKDHNTIRKRQMVIDIVQRLRVAGELKRDGLTDGDIAELFLDKKDAVLKKSQIMDTLEYGRAVHAEMAAISTAARLGTALKGATLYCTTFPCHNCAKHIVSSGIGRVLYLEPYAKSFADHLYPDSIQIDRSVDSSVQVNFRQFVGVTPTRYRSLFAKERLKNEKGDINPWRPEHAQPVLDMLDQGHTTREALFQKFVNETVKEKGRKHLQ